MVRLAQHVILHVDIDAFFASVEQVLDPALKGRAVIVGGRPGDRSVVASASYEARARGVKTAMPIAQACRICPDGVFLRGTYAHYQRASERVFAICSDYTPAVEPSSIDEGYLDMTGTERLWGADWPMSAAVSLRNRVLAETGLHVSIGIGANKLVSRVATDLAKPNGIVLVYPGCEAAFLAPMPLEAIPGIGHKTAERLAQAGLKTVADLRRVPPRLLEGRFGVVGREMAERAWGRDARPVVASAAAHEARPTGRERAAGGPSPRPSPLRGEGEITAEGRAAGCATLRRRSISRETSFERDEPDRSVVTAMLYYLAERAAWTLRSEGLLCRTVAVKLRYSDFSTVAASASLAEPSDRDGVLFAAGRGLFERLDRRRLAVRLIGVCLERLSVNELRQLKLFEDAADRKRGQVYRAQDAIRRRYGFSSLVTGRSIELLDSLERDENGFRLRTSCLTR